MKISKIACVFIFLLLIFSENIRAGNFTIVDGKNKSIILYDKDAPAIDSITAYLLAEDIERVSGYLPLVITDISKALGSVIIIGNLHSALIKKFISEQSSAYKNLNNKCECYSLNIIDHPQKNISKALLIIGSDDRGTAYGVFDISEKIGVSPWYWWADVTPKKQPHLSLNFDQYLSSPPSVKYRGIFLNDEDWGLQPWAAKTFEPVTADIGPKTYAKIFELLLRLKANLIWPAMHPSTKAFYHYPGNKKVTENYCIVIGSSHAEPMLRNNVGEWDEKKMGAFNYITNKQKVYDYWQSRVKESVSNEAVYTLGMRGVHDSGIEGVKSASEAVPLLQNIIKDQREMLKKFIQKDIDKIPQVFTPYKEVLEIYDKGLQIPDDITLVWPDDNYGYIQRLNNAEESARQGGSGIYYHASYWGRPHDYLWLSSANPSLMREEMMKAFETNSKTLWVLNVGDIKPLEYNIQLFLDMAYNAAPFKDAAYVQSYLLAWNSKIFGKENGEKVKSILKKYYELAFERRPEFMGWSQTEPTTQTNYTAYSHFNFGDQAQQRINDYDEIENEVKILRNKIGSADADAFYELVYYPVVCASLMNKKFLYRDKSFLYAKQNRASAFDYALWSQQCYDSIVAETNYYNNTLANGKWKNMMSMNPRDLPVYQKPNIPPIKIDSYLKWNISPEGITIDSIDFAKMHLPSFNNLLKQKYFIDIFLSGNKPVNWTSTTSSTWIKLSQSTGTLLPDEGKKEIRIWVDIDWNKAPKNNDLHGIIFFKNAGKQINIAISADNSPNNELENYKGFIENNGYVSIFASNYSSQRNSGDIKWQTISGLGHTGDAIQALPLEYRFNTDTTQINATQHFLQYDFYTFTSSTAEVSIYSLPTFPINNNTNVRYAVSVDNDPPKIISFKTVGRSEEWKQNVLSNDAMKKIKTSFLNKGKHSLKIYMIDPSVILDRIIIDLGGFKNSYGVIPETKIKSN